MKILKQSMKHDAATLNMTLKHLLKEVEKEMAVNKLKNYLPKTVVRSHCGTLEYLSPLGVEMLIQLSTTCQATTKDTVGKTQKTNALSPLPKPLGLTDVVHLKVQTERDVLDAHTEEKLLGLSSLVRSSEPPPNPLLTNLLEMNEMNPLKPLKRTQFGKSRIPKKFFPTSSIPISEESTEESTGHPPQDPPRKVWSKTRQS